MDILRTCTLCRTKIYSVSSVKICKKCSSKTQMSKNLTNYNCPICTYQNPKNSLQCILCEHVFIEFIENQKLQLKSSTQLLSCPKCKFENHISNQYCLNCQNELFESNKIDCPICNFKIKKINYQKHYQQCLLSKQLIQKQSKQLIQSKQIKQNQINELKINELNINELKIQQKQKQIRQINELNDRMTTLQIAALKYMRTKSYNEHKKVQKELQIKIKKLGFNHQDLDNLRFYIENYAPIIIQIHVSRHLQFFIKDTHYRNQFETNKSSGSLSRSSRTQWENRMFDNQYAKAKDFERVKYGVINFTNDPKGVQCAKTYGPSYFLLKSHVRNRCTFTDKDSSNADSSISTLDYCFKIINKMNDNELKAAFKASKAIQESSKILVTYKQLQIHGPIEFSKDIQRIYVSRDQIKGNNKLLQMVYQFSEKFKVQHDFI